MAGLEPAQREHLDYHVHAHLDIFLDGRPVVIPAGIGINVDDPLMPSGALVRAASRIQR